jgi:hypothetical protein
MLGLFVAYSALNTRGTLHFSEDIRYQNFNWLAEAFLNGQLHLKQEVDPDRLKAVDPSDPNLPFPYITDAIIYNGKYYFLKEPLPAVIHALWMVVSSRSLPTGLVVVLAALVNLALMGGILLAVRAAFFPDSSKSVLWLVWLAFAFSGPQLYIVARPNVYHESIVLGISFVLGGVLALLHGLNEERRGGLYVTLAGFLFGAGLLCKSTMFVYAVFFFLFLIGRQLMVKRSYKVLLQQGLLFVTPLCCCGALLLGYNFLRFGDFLETGLRYQCLAGKFYYYCSIDGNFARLAHIKHNLYNYLYSTPEVVNHYFVPWLRFPIQVLDDGKVLMWREKTASLFIMFPMILVSLPLLLLSRRGKQDPGLSFLVVTCFFSSLSLLAVFMTWVTAQARYTYEFTPLLFIPIFSNMAVLWDLCENSQHLRLLRFVGLTSMVTLNSVLGLYLGLNGMVQ